MLHPKNCKRCGGKMQKGGIQDYLNSKGVDGSYSARKKAFGKYFDNYRGTAEQNIELLRKIEAGEIPISGGNRITSRPTRQLKPQQTVSSTVKREPTSSPTNKPSPKSKIQVPNSPKNPQSFKKSEPTDFAKPAFPIYGIPQQKTKTSGTGNEAVDYFANLMAKRGNKKILITDKGTKKTYYGTPGNLQSFNVLTGKNDDPNALNYRNISMSEMEKSDRNKITPVGAFRMTERNNVYGEPGLQLGNSPYYFHTTYPEELVQRTALLNSPTPSDNNASYGCTNCAKPDINKLTNMFNTGDSAYNIDSRLSIPQNLEAFKKNPIRGHGGKMQAGGTVPRQEDYPDAESWQAAMDAWMSSNQQPSQRMDLSRFNTPITDENPFVDSTAGLNQPNSLQDAISKGVIEPKQGYSSAQEMYDHYNSPSTNKMKNTPEPINWQNVGIGLLRGRNVLSEISGRIARGRQNQYDYDQQSALGQMNPMPVSNFQPNPYSLYAKYGGKIKEYQKGGRTPIIVNNPNDPSLIAYKDSLYKANRDIDMLNNDMTPYSKFPVQPVVYKNMGIVDYLDSMGLGSSFDVRGSYFKDYFGGESYKGTAEQNTKLLNMLQSDKDAFKIEGGVDLPQGQIRKSYNAVVPSRMKKGGKINYRGK